eukprot:Em0047g38a
MVCPTPLYEPHGSSFPPNSSGKSPLETFNVPHLRFDHIHVDLVGPLPPSNGFTHLLTIVDRFSHWPEAVPLNDISTFACAQALIYYWISRFGIPMDMSTDRGSQFTSQLWSSVAKLLGITLHHTTAYHPQANGLVERFHRHLKTSLHARLTGPQWAQELPWVLLGIRTAPKEDAPQQNWSTEPPSRYLENFSQLTLHNLIITPSYSVSVSKFRH